MRAVKRETYCLLVSKVFIPGPLECICKFTCISEMVIPFYSCSAALNLGCVPVRASRSQRHSNPRSYLTPRGQDPPPTLSPNKCNTSRSLQSLPAQTSNQPNYPQPEVAPYSYPVLYENTQSKYNQLRNVEANSVPSLGSVYPLYYGNHFPAEKSQVGLGVPENPSYDSILVGTPVGTSFAEGPGVGSSLSLLSHGKTSNSINIVEPRDSSGKRACDLSLRLGLSSEQCNSTERSSGDAGSSHSQELSFFPRESYYHQSLFK